MSALRLWMTGCLAGIYLALPNETIYDWAARTLKIPRGAENVEMAGRPWTWELSPHVRAVMDWFRAPGKQELFICKSSQAGFTMAILIVICWHIVHRPVNIGYYIDSTEEAKKISKSRLQPWIMENKILDRVSESADDLNNLTFFLRTMAVYLMGSYAEGAFRNKSLGIVILDELDAHPPVDKQGTSADNARTRVKKYKNSKVLGFSTPKLEADQTWKEYLLGTQEKIYVPCPCCGLEQVLVWKNMRYSGPEFEDLAQNVDLKKVASETYYECANELLKCKIREADKYAMLLKGEWRATNPNAAPGKRSMHFSDLYSNFATWGELALEWIGAQTDPDKLRTFYQSRLGLPFREMAGSVKEKEVKDCRELHFRRGICPIKPVLVTLAVDVQQATMKWVLCAFSAQGDMFVVDWGETPSWDEIRELAEGEIATVHGPYAVDCGVVDEGDGNRVKEVREFTEQFAHIFPMKGRGKNQINHLIWPSKSPYEGGEILTYHINDGAYKYELVYGRIRDGAKRRKLGKKRLVLPEDVTPEFVKELLGERLEEIRNKYNQVNKEWVRTDHPNDYLDGCKYSLAIWDLMVVDLIAAGRIGPDTEVPDRVIREAA
jgi:phage terminase large subunit GpA-like protein